MTGQFQGGRLKRNARAYRFDPVLARVAHLIEEGSTPVGRCPTAAARPRQDPRGPAATTHCAPVAAGAVPDDRSPRATSTSGTGGAFTVGLASESTPSGST